MLAAQVPIPDSTCPNARSGNPGVFCQTLAGRDCALLLLVIAATVAYRRQRVVLGRDSAVVGLTVLVEECVVLGTRIGTYVGCFGRIRVPSTTHSSTSTVR